METGGSKALYNYFLNVAIDICFKTLMIIRNEMKNIDGRISVNKIEPKSGGAHLFLTKPGDILPIIEINVNVADTELENNEFAIDIRGKLEEQKMMFHSPMFQQNQFWMITKI